MPDSLGGAEEDSLGGDEGAEESSASCEGGALDSAGGLVRDGCEVSRSDERSARSPLAASRDEPVAVVEGSAEPPEPDRALAVDRGWEPAEPPVACEPMSAPSGWYRDESSRSWSPSAWLPGLLGEPVTVASGNGSVRPSDDSGVARSLGALGAGDIPA
ncbi:hypothetical protein [Haloechinothrix sp. LS1_15]|uniref:hypothetical protein n=1 Tax=Haloechinothrix sp. LS1_15 TaxID=2652248 RepID=UPI00294B6E8E|nr:hypothetical protein [Haloechinothrix sp. LS1_15]